MLHDQPDDVRSHLLRGSAHAVVAVALNGAGGFAFWWLAARIHPTADVGSAQALFSALMAVTCVTSMGLPIAVARFSADRSTAAAVHFRWALAYTAVTSVAGSVLLVGLAPGGLLDPLDPLGPAGGVLALSALATGMSFAVLVEVRLMALRQWRLVVGRVLLVVLLRVPLLWVPVADVGWWLFLAVTAVPAVSGLVGAGGLHLLGPGRGVGWRRPPAEAADWLRYASIHYLGLLGAQGPMFLIPVMVAISVDAASYAPFYIAWAITQTAVVLPHMLGQTFLVESAKPGADDRHHGVTTLVLGVGAMTLLALASFLAGPVLSRSLGPGYRSVAELLPWLLGGCVPWAVTSTVLARARLHHEVRIVAGVTAAFFVGTIAGVAVLSAGGGASGAAQGWLLGNVAAAVTAVALGGLPGWSQPRLPAAPALPPLELEAVVS